MNIDEMGGFCMMAHQYFFAGRPVPSVTTVLASAGLIDTRWYNDDAAWRGSVVHTCCHFDDEGDLDESTVPEEVRGYLDAWRRFKLETGIYVFSAIEKEYVSSLYGGRLDRVVEDTMVIDIKSGAIQEWTAIQLAAYANLIKPAGVMERIGVEIRSNGTYSMRKFPKADHRRDLQIFHAGLSIHNWKLQKGVYKNDNNRSTNGGKDERSSDGERNEAVVEANRDGGRGD